MRSLLVTRNFPPVMGGMESLNRHVALGLARAGQTAVVAPHGAAAALPPDVLVREVPLLPLWRFGFASARATVAMARRIHPTWVLAGSGLTAPMAALSARIVHARFAVYVHGLDLVVPSRMYRLTWLRCIRQADLVLANSRHTARLAIQAGVPASNVSVLTPGVTMPTSNASADVAAAWRKAHGFGMQPLLLSVGRLTERKGLVDFVQMVLPRVLQLHPEVQLVVIGSTPSYALRPGTGGDAEAIRKAAVLAGVGAHVHLLGSVSEQALMAAYSAADVHVFPVLDLPGDVEGFGMVALEAAAHGVPTIAYAVGGVPDAVSEASGRLIDPGDTAGFAAAVAEALITYRELSYRSACRDFAAEHSWSQFETGLASALAEKS